MYETFYENCTKFYKIVYERIKLNRNKTFYEFLWKCAIYINLKFHKNVYKCINDFMKIERNFTKLCTNIWNCPKILNFIKIIRNIKKLYTNVWNSMNARNNSELTKNSFFYPILEIHAFPTLSKCHPAIHIFLQNHSISLKT